MRATTKALSAVLLGGLLLFGSIASAQPGQGAEPSPQTAPRPTAPPAPDQRRAAPFGQAQAPRTEGNDDFAQPGRPAPGESVLASSNPRPEPNVVLDDLVQRVAEASGRDFLIHGTVPARIHVRGTVQQTPTYGQLVSILRTNGLTIFMAEDIVNIVPDANARTMPTRVVQQDDDRIPGDEIVTRVIRPQHVQAAQLVPSLRPMLPQEAHLTALPTSNGLLIVDRYANVKRIAEVVRLMDVEPAE